MLKRIKNYFKTPPTPKAIRQTSYVYTLMGGLVGGGGIESALNDDWLRSAAFFALSAYFLGSAYITAKEASNSNKPKKDTLEDKV